jgi:hypothetical protein
MAPRDRTPFDSIHGRRVACCLRSAMGFKHLLDALGEETQLATHQGLLSAATEAA